MIKKGQVEPQHVDLLLEQVAKRAGAESVRDAAREYLIHGGNQPEIAARHGVTQESLSRLVSKLKKLNDWAIKVSEFNR
ncbi:hypothetical protein [Neptuniibacter halophilus]|uniref:hypothetical protein n=1 Tax=Neptuniibacter halophilus TaxID=651666 RepID=UPI00257477B4|nr:hypothetical protein [Neptuniibacter halophilus]